MTLVCLAIAPFAVVSFAITSFQSRSPIALAARGRYLRVAYLIIVSAFPSITILHVFPGCIARPFRGVGVGFVETHLPLMA